MVTEKTPLAVVADLRRRWSETRIVCLHPSGIVRNAKGAPLVDPNLVVKLYGTWKETSYAPPSTQLMASETVLNNQVVLHLDLHAAMAGHTIPATVTLAGPGYIPVTDHLTVKVS